ncbi:hypothetical protein CEE37_02235 [candidate division LCP-89 bacterium B3_LCP]|uniref:Uncharacterized protein n=1 Tax=candidate division LCP-89 bacterium B3_LCP TaxID=2012998 RepID=A0A532V6E1_UNCL8|nr:MAG: hypothetical protein CEE37_02235 [candidate division LCP-89 bacterium B3_LCP]
MLERDRYFCRCDCCGTEWLTRKELLNDQSVVFKGFQPNWGSLAIGWFQFYHTFADCKSPFAVNVNGFFDLIEESRVIDTVSLRDECPGYCGDQELDYCHEECEYAIVIELTKMLKAREEDQVYA